MDLFNINAQEDLRYSHPSFKKLPIPSLHCTIGNEKLVLYRYIYVVIFRIPNLEVSGEAGEVEIEVSDDQYDVHSIDVSNVPVICTVSKVSWLSF